MLEVYFNIVEWGYHIYGIGAASRYYFGKTPSQLTLGESIFLASLLPNPKAGLYAFQPDGSLRQGLHGYFNLIGNLMAGHGKAQRDSNAYGFYEVRLKESLRRGISNLDTAKVDSLMQQSNDDDAIPIVEPEKKMNFFQRLFGKKDTTSKATKKEVKKTNHSTLVDYGDGIVIDTAGKTKKQIRQEKRALVGSLPFKLEEADLKELFEAYGEVSSVKLINDRETGRSKGFGFVEMPDDESAQQAITALNGSEVGGRTIAVSQAEERKPNDRKSFGGGGNRGGGGGYGGGGNRGGGGGGYSKDSRGGGGGSRW